MNALDKSMKIEVAATESSAVMVAMAVRGVCEITRLTSVDVNRLELCLVEVFNNAVEHAYENKDGYIVEIDVNITTNYMSLVVNDWGLPIPSDCIKATVLEPDCIKNIIDLKDSGRGLYIVKNLMGKIDYCSKDGKNSFRLSMNFPE